MRRTFLIMLSFCLICLCSACADNPSNQTPTSKPSQEVSIIPSETGALETESEVPDMTDTDKILVAYFSRTGNTRALAEEIAEQTGAEVFEIIPAEPYPDDYNATVERFRKERAENARPAIASEVANMEQFSTVFIGFPNWGDDMPHIVYTFLEQYDLSGKTVVPFCTNGGGGFGNSLDGLKRTCPDSIVADGFECSGSRADRQQENVSKWLAEIGVEVQQ